MRRVGHLWPRVVAFDNLLSATRRAAAGKRDRATVARFLERREPEILGLQRELESGTWRPGVPTTFTILDPKERTITAAPFRDRVVHHVKEVLRIPGYVRSMDDFVLFADDKARLREAHAQVVEFLGQHLKLREKTRATILGPAHAGLPFLGWTLYRGTLRLRPANRQRSLRRLQARRRQYRAGHIDMHTLAAAELSVLEHLRHGATLPLRRRWSASAPREEPAMS